MKRNYNYKKNYMEKIYEIYTDQIDDPKDAMRSELDRNALFDLAENIKQNGLINPITVRLVHTQACNSIGAKFEIGKPCMCGDRLRYEVVAGHRRLSACKIAGIIKISCVVRDLNDHQTFEIMAAENLERADVDPVDEAIFISNFLQKTGKSVTEVAKALKRSVAYVESRLMVGKMPDYMQAYLKNKEISLGVCLSLIEITDEATLRTWTDMAVRDGVSVAQADYWVHGWRVSQLPGGSRAETPPEGFVAGTTAPIVFECQVDGKKYPAADMHSVMIYKGNLEFFRAVCAEFRKPPVEQPI
jgi:ParB family chromosome partitioning protein